MKVRELIAKLMECDPDAMVVVYSDLDEGADFASNILVTQTGFTNDPQRPYVKGDWPDSGIKVRLPMVIIL